MVGAIQKNVVYLEFEKEDKVELAKSNSFIHDKALYLKWKDFSACLQISDRRQIWKCLPNNLGKRFWVIELSWHFAAAWYEVWLVAETFVYLLYFVQPCSTVRYVLWNICRFLGLLSSESRLLKWQKPGERAWSDVKTRTHCLPSKTFLNEFSFCTQRYSIISDLKLCNYGPNEWMNYWTLCVCK